MESRYIDSKILKGLRHKRDKCSIILILSHFCFVIIEVLTFFASRSIHNIGRFYGSIGQLVHSDDFKWIKTACILL